MYRQPAQVTFSPVRMTYVLESRICVCVCVCVCVCHICGGRSAKGLQQHMTYLMSYTNGVSGFGRKQSPETEHEWPQHSELHGFPPTHLHLHAAHTFWAELQPLLSCPTPFTTNTAPVCSSLLNHTVSQGGMLEAVPTAVTHACQPSGSLALLCC